MQSSSNASNNGSNGSNAVAGAAQFLPSAGVLTVLLTIVSCCLVVGVCGLVVTYRYIRKNSKLAAVRLCSLCGYGTSLLRLVGVGDLGTDIALTDAMFSGGHPNYGRICLLFVVLPFVAMFAFVGYAFVQRQREDARGPDKFLTTVKACVLWLCVGPFVIVLSELLLFSWFLFVRDRHLSKGVLWFDGNGVGVPFWFEDYMVNYLRLRLIVEVAFEGLPFLSFLFFVFGIRGETHLVSAEVFNASVAFSVWAVGKNVFETVTNARRRKMTPTKYLMQVFSAGTGTNPALEGIVNGKTSIDCDGHDFTPAEMEAVGAALKGNTTVQKISFQRCGLTDDHVRRFVDAGGMQCASLEDVNLGECGLTPPPLSLCLSLRLGLRPAKNVYPAATLSGWGRRRCHHRSRAPRRRRGRDLPCAQYASHACL